MSNTWRYQHSYLSQNKQLNSLNAFTEVLFFSHAWLPGRLRSTFVRKDSSATEWRDVKWLTLNAGIIPEALSNKHKYAHLKTVFIFTAYLRAKYRKHVNVRKEDGLCWHTAKQFHVCLLLQHRTRAREQQQIPAWLCLYKLSKILYHQVLRSSMYKLWLTMSGKCIHLEYGSSQCELQEILGQWASPVGTPEMAISPCSSLASFAWVWFESLPQRQGWVISASFKPELVS